MQGKRTLGIIRKTLIIDKPNVVHVGFFYTKLWVYYLFTTIICFDTALGIKILNRSGLDHILFFMVSRSAQLFVDSMKINEPTQRRPSSMSVKEEELNGKKDSR